MKNPNRNALAALALVVAAPLAIAACAGQPIVSPIEGEPVCADYDIGAAHSKMAGGLRFPVQVTIKSGKTQVFKTIVLGRRTEKDEVKRVLLPDDNDTLQVEWAQCENERASNAVDAAGRDTKGTAKYECGNATAYKTEDLQIKKGDPSSHKLTFPAPPNVACLQGVAASPAPTASAGAAPTAAATADAAPSGTATADAAPSASASAAPTGSASAAPTGSATATAAATGSAAPKK